MGRKMLPSLVAIFSLLTSVAFGGRGLFALGCIYSEQGNEKFLPPDQAFQLDAIIKKKAVLIEWQIAEGYYLYKEKTAVKYKLKDQNRNLDFPSIITMIQSLGKSKFIEIR